MRLNRHIQTFSAIILAVCFFSTGCGEESPTYSSNEVKSSTVSSEQIEQSLDAAQQYVNSNELKKAVAILTTLIDRAPKNVQARELFGQVLMLSAIDAQNNGIGSKASDYRKQSYNQYRIATELAPDSSVLHHQAGIIASIIGDYDAALQLFQAAGRLDPNNPQHPLYESQLLIQKERFDEAIAALQRVVSIDPDEPIAYASLANIAMEQVHFQLAQEHIAVARQLEPANVDFRVQEAKIYRRMGKPQRSLELLIGLSGEERAKESVAYELATAFEQLGKFIEAAEVWMVCFKNPSQSNPAWKSALRVAESFHQAGDRDQAWTWLEEARLLAPSAPEVQSFEETFRQ